MTACLEHLGARIARSEARNLAAPVREKLRLHVADTIAAWVAGSRTAEGRALVAFRRREAGNDACDAYLLDAVGTHCALARLSEVDDIHLASMTTPGSIVIPAAFTIARRIGGHDPADLSSAIVAGYEAMIRLGLAIDGPTVLYRGIWPTYFAAPFAVAAVAARLLRLDERQTAHALALALTFASPGVGHHNAPTTSRWLAVGNAARNGLQAAFAAQAGFTADVSLIDSGFLANVYGIAPRTEALTEDFDEPLFLQVSLKPWCAARQTMAATQALREVLDDGVRPEDITAVHASVLPPHLKMIDHGVAAGNRASYLTSLPYQMAIAALEPATALDLAVRELSPALQEFMGRIQVSGDEQLLPAYPSAWPARISVETRAGKREHHVTHVPGDPPRLLAEGDVAAKFDRLLGPIIGGGEAHSLRCRIADASADEGSLTTLLAAIDRIGSAGEC